MAALLFGFPIFFDAGLVVFLPIVFTVARRMGGSLLTYGLPVAGAFAVMHAFVPPHPGPVAAAELIGADIGLVLLFGLLIGLPTWYLGAYLFGTWAGSRYHVGVPDLLSAGSAPQPAAAAAAGPAAGSRRVSGGTSGSGSETVVEGTSPAPADPSPAARTGSGTAGPPPFGTVIALLLLPLVLIFFNTGMNTLVTVGAVDEESFVARAATLVGATPVALLITVLVASYVRGSRRGTDGRGRVGNSALGPVCAIILITGAGGMFGGVLRASGIGQALADVLADLGLPVIVAAFVISVLLRVAQGSATVALTTAAGLIAPVVEASRRAAPPGPRPYRHRDRRWGDSALARQRLGLLAGQPLLPDGRGDHAPSVDRHGDPAGHAELRLRAAAQPGAVSG